MECSFNKAFGIVPLLFTCCAFSDIGLRWGCTPEPWPSLEGFWCWPAEQERCTDRNPARARCRPPDRSSWGFTWSVRWVCPVHLHPEVTRNYTSFILDPTFTKIWEEMMLTLGQQTTKFCFLATSDRPILSFYNRYRLFACLCTR